MSYKRPGLDALPANAEDEQVQFAQETTGHWIGPFPPPDLMNILCSPASDVLEDLGDPFGGIPREDGALETTMYEPLVR